MWTGLEVLLLAVVTMQAVTVGILIAIIKSLSARLDRSEHDVQTLAAELDDEAEDDAGLERAVSPRRPIGFRLPPGAA